MGQGAVYYDRIVKPALHSFMGSVFEEMCQFYTLNIGIQGQFGNFITETGSWWGTEPVTENGTKKYLPADIDVVAVSTVDKTAVIGECKFKNEKIDKAVYETLVRRGAVISNKYRIIKYLFFSLSGYTEWFDSMKDESICLYTLTDLYTR